MQPPAFQEFSECSSESEGCVTHTMETLRPAHGSTRLRFGDRLGYDIRLLKRGRKKIGRGGGGG